MPFKNVYFEIIVDTHVVLRNNTEIPYTVHPVSHLM